MYKIRVLFYGLLPDKYVIRRTTRLMQSAIETLDFTPPAQLSHGIPEIESDCSLARTFESAVCLPVSVYCEGACFKDPGDAGVVAYAWGTCLQTVEDDFGNLSYAVSMPDIMKEFVNRFDDGRFPQLVTSPVTILQPAQPSPQPGSKLTPSEFSWAFDTEYLIDLDYRPIER